MYIKKLILTRTRLMERGIEHPLDYELHVPMIMQKDKLKTIISKHPSCLWRSMYGNIYGVGGSQMDDVKFYVNQKHAARSKEITEESTFLSTEDQSFGLALSRVLIKLFPEPSNYEQN
jgi:hypothetical protein